MPTEDLFSTLTEEVLGKAKKITHLAYQVK
jgi:hypothetical protein